MGRRATTNTRGSGHGEGGSSSRHIELSDEERAVLVRLFSLLVGEDLTRPQLPQSAVHIAQAVLKDRRRRSEVFGRAMFGEPAWELLLTLYVMAEDGPPPTIGGLAVAADVRTSTALRWLSYLEGHGLIAREDHPTDARTAIVKMTDKGRELLTIYFGETITPGL